MLFKPKGSRHKNLFEIILAFLELKKVGQLYNKIIYHFKILKFFITTTIIHEEAK